eukprot:3812588-Pyramimonas_sp.AAC.1
MSALDPNSAEHVGQLVPSHEMLHAGGRMCQTADDAEPAMKEPPMPSPVFSFARTCDFPHAGDVDSAVVES